MVIHASFSRDELPKCGGGFHIKLLEEGLKSVSGQQGIDGAREQREENGAGSESLTHIRRARTRRVNLWSPSW